MLELQYPPCIIYTVCIPCARTLKETLTSPVLLQMIQELSREMNQELSLLPVRNELITSLDQRARELKDKLEMYRQNYNAFAQLASSKLGLEISKTLGGWRMCEICSFV